MIIKVKVKPGSKEERIEKLEEGSYVVCVKERAEDGRANLALRKILAKEFNVSALDVKIKTPTLRHKIVFIDM